MENSRPEIATVMDTQQYPFAHQSGHSVDLISYNLKVWFRLGYSLLPKKTKLLFWAQYKRKRF